MADIPTRAIAQLPLANALRGNELFPLQQNDITKAATISQISDFVNEGVSTLNYTTLRSLFNALYVLPTGYRILVRTQGLTGVFWYDQTDSTSTDNGGTLIVDATGRRWKRLFNGLLFVEWFGASEGASASVNTIAWKAAIAATLTGTDSAGVTPILTWAGEHTINETLNVALTTERGFRMIGSGTTLDGRGSRLMAATTFTGSVLLQLQGTATALDAIDVFELDNFALLAQAGTTCTVGLQIGETAKLVDATTTNKVTRLSIEGFSIECKALNARDIYWGLNTFSANGVVGGTAFRLETDSVAFQSDGHDFEGNTFTGPVGSGKGLSIANGTNGAVLKGIKLYGRNKFYQGSIALEINASTSGATIGDIFNDTSQFDGTVGSIQIYLAAGATIEGVYNTNCYFAANPGDSAAFALKADIATSGVKQISLIGCNIKYYAAQAVLLNNVDTIRHEINEYYQVHSSTSIVKFDGCSNVSSGGNVLSRGPDGDAQYFIEFAADCSKIKIYPDQADSAALSVGIINDLTTTLFPFLDLRNWLVVSDRVTNQYSKAQIAIAAGMTTIRLPAETYIETNTLDAGIVWIGEGVGDDLPRFSCVDPTADNIALGAGGQVHNVLIRSVFTKDQVTPAGTTKYCPVGAFINPSNASVTLANWPCFITVDLGSEITLPGAITSHDYQGITVTSGTGYVGDAFYAGVQGNGACGLRADAYGSGAVAIRAQTGDYSGSLHSYGAYGLYVREQADGSLGASQSAVYLDRIGAGSSLTISDSAATGDKTKAWTNTLVEKQTSGTIHYSQHSASTFTGLLYGANMAQGSGTFSGDFFNFKLNSVLQARLAYNGLLQINEQLQVLSGGSGVVNLQYSGGDTYLDWTGNLNFRSITGGYANKMLVNSTGVGIGNTNPQRALHTTGTIRFSSLPTSSAGLSSGDIWNNAGVLNVIP